MVNKNNAHLRGSPEVWSDVYKSLDLAYSEKDLNQGRLFELVKIEFLSGILPKAPCQILEVGCGTAFVSLYFAKRKYNVACLDINKKILDVARDNFKKEKVKGKFKVGNAEKLPFRDSQFDVVMSFGLLEHFEDPSQAIREMVRVLKPGGLFFADIVPRRFSCQSLENIFNSLVVFVGYSLRGNLKLATKKARLVFRPLYYENSISFAEYRDMMKNAGLEKISIYGNRPYPRLTLPRFLDHAYAILLSKTMLFWHWFDGPSAIACFWGAGWWFWGYKKKK